MSPAARRKDQSSALLSTAEAGTRPRAVTCTSCGQRLLAARTTAGLDLKVTAAPLSPAGELAALLVGVPTYTHHVVQGDLAWRYPLVIRSRPAGTAPRQTVHALHRCGDTWLALPPALDPTAAPDPDAPPPY